MIFELRNKGSFDGTTFSAFYFSFENMGDVFQVFDIIIKKIDMNYLIINII